MSSRSTAHILRAVFDKIVGAFNRSSATQAVAWFGTLVFSINSRLMEFQVGCLALLSGIASVTDGLKWF